MNRKIVWFIPSVLVALGIFLLSTFLAIPIQLDWVGYLDKIEHSFAYMVLIVSFMFAFKKAGVLNSKKAILILLFTSLYGFSLELVQYVFFSYRYFEWADALANVVGVLIGFGIFKLLDRG